MYDGMYDGMYDRMYDRMYDTDDVALAGLVS